MKKLVLFMALAITVAFTSCSKDDAEATDAIVGTWAMENTSSSGSETIEYRSEWIFKADNSGSYKVFTDGDITDETSFVWEKSSEAYNVDYSDEGFSDDTFTIGELLGKKTLQKGETTFAFRE